MTPSPFHDVKSDGISFSVTPVDLLFQNGVFAHGSGFIWNHDGSFWLVTNWHNLSGLHPFDGSYLNENGRVPDRIRIHPRTMLHQDGGKTEINRHPIEISLYDDFHSPHWVEHSTFGTTRCDVALIKLPASDHNFIHVNQYQYEPLFTYIGADLLIAGYPFQNYVEDPLHLPIWKRGALASEPIFGWRGRPAFLIDAASRPGMSGSPVFRRVFGPAAAPDGNGGYVINAGNVMTSEFVGIYSGHLSTQAADVTIGFAWYGALIGEILNDPRPGTRA